MTTTTEKKRAHSLEEFMEINGLKDADLHPAIPLIADVAKEIGWPFDENGCTTDLYDIDFAFIQKERQYTEFFVGFYAYGTHMFVPSERAENPNALRRHILDRTDTQFYHWNGSDLLSVTKIVAAETAYNLAREARKSWVLPCVRNAEIAVPTIDELRGSLDFETDELLKTPVEEYSERTYAQVLERIYGDELATMLRYARNCKRPHVWMAPFYHYGRTQWIADFGVDDCDTVGDDRRKYAGGIMIDDKGRVSSHH